jgi:hypothetical protein
VSEARRDAWIETRAEAAAGETTVAAASEAAAWTPPDVVHLGHRGGVKYRRLAADAVGGGSIGA